MKILLIEDERITRISLTATLQKEGYDVKNCDTGLEGLEMIRNDTFDVVITDLRLPKTNGIEILRFIKEKSPKTFVIVITAYASVDTAIEALRLGAYDYLTKPFEPDKLLTVLDHIRQMVRIKNENTQLKNRLSKIENRTLIGNSPAMKLIRETIRTVADNHYTILIQGESGTGKEMVAQALHSESLRAKKPFIAVNCAAIPETLLESELFGHEKGAFTGADKQHQGYFERADNGTLFIDDIDDFPYNLQVKLLRVLQEKEFTRVGGSKLIPMNARIICAGKVDLRKKVEEGTFREDLYYRLHIIPITIPPLRNRKEDIPRLLEHFFNKNEAKELLSRMTTKLLNQIQEYSWPGNIRELENFVERFIALSGMSDWKDILLSTFHQYKHENDETGIITPVREFNSFDQYIARQEAILLQWALEKADRNISKAAELLKLPRSTFRSKLEKMEKLNHG